jgi:MinD superfamily P-loop ATPase
VRFEKIAKENADIIGIDTPSGTHCNVVQIFRSADRALVVTEPTHLGIYYLDFASVGS